MSPQTTVCPSLEPKQSVYHSALEVSGGDGNPVVSAKLEDRRSLTSTLAGPLAAPLLRTWDSGSGSGIFCSLMFVTLSTEPGIDVSVDGVTRTNRFVVKKVASVDLEGPI
jgi:hypothetical protein